MKRLVYHFNLVEIVLAVAVIGFGVVVILGMLPKGMRATQNAGIEAYSSEIIDQMGNYLQQKGADGVTAAAATVTDEKTLLTNFTGQGQVADKYIRDNYTSLIWYIHSWTAFSGSGDLKNFQRTNMSGVFKIRQDIALGSISSDDMPKIGDLYVVVMGNTWEDEDGEKDSKIDFSGLLRVWKRPMEYQKIRIIHKGVTTVQMDEALPNTHHCEDAGNQCAEGDYYLQRKNTGSFDGKYATVCMELSYPLSLPYAERTKRYYSFDVEKQE